MYVPPGAAASMRVLSSVAATHQKRDVASIVRYDLAAEHGRPSGTAVDAVRGVDRAGLD